MRRDEFTPGPGAGSVSWVLRQGACNGHPVLSPDAWTQVEKGYPRGDGARALLVCRLACPVRMECKELVPRGVDTISGGGWTDRKSRYREPKEDLFDANMAAAFLGVTVDRVQKLGKRRLPTVVREKGRSWYHETDVWALAETVSPCHGTESARELHLIRGERLCQRCHTLPSKTFEASTADRSTSSSSSEAMHCAGT